jgi:hypothetical protein
MHGSWVTNLSNYVPKKEGHWPADCAGFNLSCSGRIWLTDNEDIWIDKPNIKGYTFPCHRDLVDGDGHDKTIYSGLYCWKGEGGATLWLYHDTERAFNAEMLAGLKSLIGVHNIDSNTKVFSNTWRYEIASLGADYINSKPAC